MGAGGLNVMNAVPWKCGRALRAGVSPSGRVDSPWTTQGVDHRLPTLSRLSPTSSTGPTTTSFFLKLVKRKTGQPLCFKTGQFYLSLTAQHFPGSGCESLMAT